jgi:hypothetical protein
MFVRYFLELTRPFEEVERALLSGPEDWVPGLASEAEARGKQLLAEVGFGLEGRRLEKQVEIEVGQPVRFPTKTVLPMSWRPTGTQVLFPLFEADIEVAALGLGQTQLSVSARYRPPLGVVGRVIDRAVMHRVAEATVKDFLDRAADALAGTVPNGRRT